MEYNHRRIVLDRIKIINSTPNVWTVTVNGIRVDHFASEEAAIAWAKENYPDNVSPTPYKER